MWKYYAFLLPLSLSAATPGAWEAFSTETNADAWGLFDYADGQTYFVDWFDDAAAGAAADPFVGADFLSDPNQPSDEPVFYNQPFSIFADEHVGEGAFIGDYHAAGIAGVEVDVLITNPELFSSCDITFTSDGAGSTEIYYSESFGANFFPSNPVSWTTLTVTFEEQWFTFNEATQQFEAVALTEAILGSVSEVAIRFFPIETNETLWAPFIDNFALTPTIVAPLPTPDFDNGNFVMTFDAAPGNRYDIQQFNLATEIWEDLAGQTDLVPAGSIHTFETSIAPGKGLFRVSAETNYELIISASPAPGS